MVFFYLFVVDEIEKATIRKVPNNQNRKKRKKENLGLERLMTGISDIR